jgi:RNA polymerase sigma factor (sigma-70 family)
MSERHAASSQRAGPRAARHATQRAVVRPASVGARPAATPPAPGRPGAHQQGDTAPSAGRTATPPAAGRPGVCGEPGVGDGDATMASGSHGATAAWIAATARRARAGDHEALVALHRALASRHAARIWYAQRRAPGVPDGLERADLEQQAFLVLMGALRTWPGNGDFGVWFGRAAQWSLRRYTRRWLRTAPAQPAGRAPDCATWAVERADCAALLARLPTAERAVLRWRFWQDLTFAQIAARYGVPPATAHDRYRSALARLRRLLSEEGGQKPEDR